MTIQVDVDSEESREEALQSVTRLIRDSLATEQGVVRVATNGVADFIPTDAELAELGVGGGSRGA